MDPSPSLAQTAPTQPLRPVQHGLIQDDPDLTWRILRLLNFYRVLAALLLLGLHVFSDLPQIVGAEHPALFVAAALALLVFGALNTFAVAHRWPGLLRQLTLQLAIDISMVVTMMHASGGIRSGLGSLLVISVGASSLLLPRRAGALAAAVAALAILGEQSLSQLQGVTTGADYIPAGVLGAILFAIALAAYPISRRIRETEALAEQRGVDLANLAELNDYIIQNLRESIVVVDGTDRIRLINESAARHLGVYRDSTGTPLAVVSPKLSELVGAWRERHAGNGAFVPASGAFTGADGSSVINPHFAPMGTTQQGALLIFLEDASLLAEKVQQSKLAALGRLSASIAHEIRNPVGAMSHAGQLLAESSTLSEPERRLTEIIHNNADRVSTIIDNVQQLSRRDSTRPERLRLEDWTREFVGNFCLCAQIPRERFTIECETAGIEVLMDPSHLEQIMSNLCENALKYGCPNAESDRIELRIGRMPRGDRPFLEVADSGEGIDDDALDQIFEPFFTGKGGGSGLGLFISRELAECNRARLFYHRGEFGGSVFRIVFSDPQRWQS
jgi:two-component system sensor histidine kinase PilS (NtrC family)